MKYVLCMIVRNEAPVIARCLRSVLPFITRWVIVDTGSTDETESVARTVLGNMPGRYLHRPWVDFAHNRSEALREAEADGDWVLSIDADDELVVPEGFDCPFDTAALGRAPFLAMLHQLGDMDFWRISLIQSGKDCRYVGRCHEYLQLPKGAATSRLSGPKILCHHDVGRDYPGKYDEQVALLREDFHRTGDLRALFYLAQALRDSGNCSEAFDCYQLRGARRGWLEESWYARFQAAKMYAWIHRDAIRDAARAAPGDPRVTRFDVSIGLFQNAHRMRPTRAEPLVAGARLCLDAGFFHEAVRAALMAADINYPVTDALFIDRSIYRWRARTILAEALLADGRTEEARGVARAILDDRHLPAEAYRVAAGVLGIEADPPPVG